MNPRKPREATIHIFRHVDRAANLLATIRNQQTKNLRRFSSYPPTRARDEALARARLDARAKRVVAELDTLFTESERLRRDFETHAAQRIRLLERRKALVSGQLAAHRALVQISIERAALGDKCVRVREESLTLTVL